MTAARSEWMLYGAYGRTCTAAILETGEGYRAAAHAALRAAELQLRDRHIGALTPVQAFGSEFALLVPDTRIQGL